MELISILVFLVVFVMVWFWFKGSNHNLPPFPIRPLPIIGNLYHMKRDPRPQFEAWRKQCGDIFSLYLGGNPIIVLNDYELIKEVLVKNGDAVSDRPKFYVEEVNGLSDQGLIYSSGAIWKEQRSVNLTILRAFGMGKNILAFKIQEEVQCFINYLSGLKGNPTDIRIMTSISTCNVICSILFGHRFEHDDKTFQELIQKLNTLVNEQDNVSLINFYFWVRHLPGDLFKAKTLAANMKPVMSLLAGFIEEKRQHIEHSGEVSNLIDAYTLERNKKLKAGIPTSLDDQNLLKSMYDLFEAGTETTSTTIYWCILFLLHYPEVQEKIFQEIKYKIGTDRSPNIQDKTNLTYVNAAILETQRLASIVPLSVTHLCSEEVNIRGYTLPKGAYIMPNLDAVLYDKDTWGEDAMTFKPERFIDNNGKLSIPEQFIPFGIGRRICLGESLAKMELFLFLSTMLQKFQFLPVDPSVIPPTTYESGLVVSPTHYKVRAVPRTRD